MAVIYTVRGDFGISKKIYFISFSDIRGAVDVFPQFAWGMSGIAANETGKIEFGRKLQFVRDLFYAFLRIIQQF